MGNLCANLVLYVEFKCVWLTFYLFLVFSWADLSSLSLCMVCHGRRWLNATLVPCDKETLMSSLWIVSFIRCMHWHSLCMPPNLPLKIGKCQSQHTGTSHLQTLRPNIGWWTPIFAFPPIIFLLDGLHCNSDGWPWERQLMEWGSGCLSYVAS